MNLQRECFIYWHRTPPPGLRFVRAIFAADGIIPSPYSLDDRTVLGHTLTAEGKCVRLFYLILTAPGDGCAEYTPDSLYKDAEAGSPDVRIRQPLGPMQAEYSTAALRAEEDLARIEPRKHWVAYHEREMKRKAAEQAEIKAAEQPAPKPIIVAPPPAPKPSPKRSLFARIVGY